MSAKYLHTIADDNPDLHKQLGCMNGIFQLFNRQHFVTGRRISSHSRKKLPPGESGKNGKEHDTTVHKSTEKNLNIAVKERERSSLESSSTNSFSSSSCSSTFSSIDCNKVAQPDPSLLGRSPLSKTPSKVVPKKQPDHSLHSGQQSPDIRNIVKSSIQRDTCELAIKTRTKSEGKTRVMKHIDSPRPQPVFKPVSPKVLAPDKSSQASGIKARNSALPPKDAPRFSYDERESRDKWKSVAKLRELPRFSLDSRESRRASSEPRSNTLLEDLQQRKDQRLSSVVAKLMGLEAFPDSTDTNKCRPQDKAEPINTPSSRKADEKKYNQVSNSPRLTPRDTLSPKLRKNDSPSKSNPRFPLEPAPWRQTNGNQESHNSAEESQLKPQSLYPSVYGQIAKRLTDLEFKKSGKDLRALKQILEAMHKARESIEDQEDDRSSYKLKNFPSVEIALTIKGSNSPKKFEAPIAIARPAKVVQKNKSSGSSLLSIEGVPSLCKLRTVNTADTKKELTPRKTKLKESSQRSPRPMAKRSSAATYTSKQTSVSPRMQHNKQGVEKQPQPISHTSEASTPRRTANRHHTEIFSPVRTSKPKSLVWQESGDEQLSEISSEARCLGNQTDAFSVCSESNISTASNDEVTSNYRSEVPASLHESRSKSGNRPATFEQPSPISVLDTAFYTEESPSPVKKISSAFTDEDNFSSDEALFNPVDQVEFLTKTRPHLVLEFGDEKLENIKHLNEKLRKVDLHIEDDADRIALLCESTDPMHIYVAEVLLASGIFNDLGPSSSFTQLHSSRSLINPQLFHILEQGKNRTPVEDDEQSNGKINQSKLHEKTSRKHVFDTTDEILVQILISAGFSNPWISPNKAGLRSLTGKKLLEKICLEMDHLQTNPECSLPYENEVMDFEIPGVVLDIERMIFKDLICEIASGEAGLPSQLNRHRRQLFTN